MPVDKGELEERIVASMIEIESRVARKRIDDETIIDRIRNDRGGHHDFQPRVHVAADLDDRTACAWLVSRHSNWLANRPKEIATNLRMRHGVFVKTAEVKRALEEMADRGPTADRPGEPFVRRASENATAGSGTFELTPSGREAGLNARTMHRNWGRAMTYTMLTIPVLVVAAALIVSGVGTLAGSLLATQVFGMSTICLAIPLGFVKMLDLSSTSRSVDSANVRADMNRPLNSTRNARSRTVEHTLLPVERSTVKTTEPSVRQMPERPSGGGRNSAAPPDFRP